MKKKTISLIAFAIITITIYSSIIRSDQEKIRTAAIIYVEGKLKAGEKMKWGHIERKLSRDVNGRECKYAEIKYKIKTINGEYAEKNLFLLMSEHCDTVYEITEY